MATINIRRVLVDIMLEIAPYVYGAYFIMYHKGVKKLIVQCQNTIYGTMTTVMLYYKKFRNSIEDEGYDFNPYDPCVTHNIIKGIHITVCFHVENCELSQKVPKVVGKMITWLKKI